MWINKAQNSGRQRHGKENRGSILFLLNAKSTSVLIGPKCKVFGGKERREWEKSENIQESKKQCEGNRNREQKQVLSHSDTLCRASPLGDVRGTEKFHCLTRTYFARIQFCHVFHTGISNQSNTLTCLWYTFGLWLRDTTSSSAFHADSKPSKNSFLSVQLMFPPL